VSERGWRGGKKQKKKKKKQKKKKNKQNKNRTQKQRKKRENKNKKNKKSKPKKSGGWVEGWGRDLCAATLCSPWASAVGERIFIELMTLDRKLEASREGSIRRICGN